MKTNLFQRFAGSIAALSALLLLAPVLTGCNDDPDKYEKPSAEITPAIPNNKIQFEDAGGIFEFALKTNREWTAELSKGADWLAISPQKGGEGNHKITLQALPNTGTPRFASLVVKVSTESFFFTIEQKGEGGQDIVAVPLAKIVEMGAGLSLDKGSLTIDQPLYVKVVVTTDFKGKNFPFEAYHHIQDEAGTAIVLTKAKGGSPVEQGTELLINCEGATLTNYSGTLQLQAAGEDKIISRENAMIEPQTTTIADVLAGKHMNQYIRIDGVQFEKYEGLKLYDGTFSTKRHTIIDRKGDKITLEVSKNAVFKEEAVPAGSGSFLGVATINITKDGKTFYNIKPSVLSDLNMKGERFNVTPNPEPQPEPTPNDFVTLDKLVEKGLQTDNNGIVINEDMMVKAVVVANNADKQFPFPTYCHIQDEKGNAIVLTTPKGDPGTMIELFTEISFNLKGGKIKNYFGTVQLEVASSAFTLGAKKAIEPKVVTIPDVKAGKHLYQYIRINKVKFESTGVFNETKKVKNLTIVDEQGNKLTLEINGNASFKAEAIPSGIGYVIGVGTQYKPKDGAVQYNIRPALRSDMVF